ncbi:flagellar filament capping protein FliD [Pelotomaculum propionicicum]|uniref:flagellar filament capping protein FliD n=1 Tax=Pelotomaculum propionicicum TaxID=258475 RepID=UPI003B80DCCF
MSISGVNRYFGLSGSGLDIDSIVSDLMKVQRLKQDKIKQNKTLTEWKRSDYREVNNAMRTLRDSVFSMKLQRTFQAKDASSSNEGIVKVSASNNALAGGNTVKVTALAGNARLNSSAEVTFNSSGTNLQEQLGLASTDPIVFTVNGSAEISIDPSTDTINSMVGKINNADAGITAFYDETLNRMFISSNETGAEAAIDFENVSNASELFGALNLGADPFAAVYGNDAAFELNGTALTQSSNQFTIAGVSYTLTGTSTTETAYVNISSDTDGIYESIKTFVELYNTTIEEINSKITEDRDKNYRPLTDDEREELTDDQEEDWEEIAKTGLLRNDLIVSGILTDMRSALGSIVSGVDSDYSTLASIGITTGDYTERGKLYIDEDKLMEAIGDNPEAVMDLFTNASDVDSEEGLAVRLYDDLNNGIDKLISKAGSDSSFSAVDNSYLGKEIDEYEEQITIWDDRLEKIEERYYTQFSALETALSRMNQQSSWLYGMLSSGS